MDMPDRALSLLDDAQRHYQLVDELLEVVLKEAQVHEVVLDHGGVCLVAGTHMNHLIAQ
jgi:hypothetical protein